MVWTKALGHRSVEDSIKVFCGWPRLEKLVEEQDNKIVKLLILSLFKTGARCNEALTLYREQIEVTEARVKAIDMPVLKRHLKIVPYRTVPIRLDERLTDQWVDLMPDEGKFFDFKYDKAYKIIRSLETLEGVKGPWWPHRFRAERARQLVKDYGFDALLLKQFFQMARIDTPLFYANPDLAAVEAKMGI
jgi:hypothetical protein